MNLALGIPNFIVFHTSIDESLYMTKKLFFYHNINNDYNIIIEIYHTIMDYSTIYREIEQENDPIKMDTFINEINNFVVNKLDKKFDKIFGKYKNKVYEIFEKTKCVISGSVILQILLNEEWTYGDIDIFYFDKNCSNSYDAWYFPDNNINRIIQNFDFELVNEPSCIYQTLFNFVKNDKKYDVMSNTGIKNNGETIQFICIFVPDELDKNELNNLDLINLLTEKFDFDICKNFISFEKKKMICNINNIAGILSKKFLCNINYKQIYDVDKSNQINIDNENNEEQMNKPYYYLNKKNDKYSRKTKYLNRGFTFTGYAE